MRQHHLRKFVRIMLDSGNIPCSLVGFPPAQAYADKPITASGEKLTYIFPILFCYKFVYIVLIYSQIYISFQLKSYFIVNYQYRLGDTVSGLYSLFFMRVYKIHTFFIPSKTKNI